MRYALLALFLTTPALAQDCPAAPDHSKELTALITAAQNAPDEGAARQLAPEFWAIWTDAPDDHAQELLDEGMDRRRAFDFDGALRALDALVEYCPDYAEGYNQRAFVNFLRQDFSAALPDLDRALALSPRHIGALSGRALTLTGLGRKAEAALSLRAALALNPWLTERSLLPALEADEEEL
jgi:tetratricopeptide (TPR) repeat protein